MSEPGDSCRMLSGFRVEHSPDCPEHPVGTVTSAIDGVILCSSTDHDGASVPATVKLTGYRGDETITRFSCRWCAESRVYVSLTNGWSFILEPMGVPA